MDLSSLGKLLVTVGLLIAIAGGLLWLLGLSPLGVGRLPGDIHLRGERWSFYFPLTTCIIISIILTILLNIFVRLFR